MENMVHYGIFLIMGSAGFISSTVSILGNRLGTLNH